MPPSIDVLVVDDSPTARQLLAHIVNSSPDMRVVAEASNGQHAIDLARKLRPTIILMDIIMPKVDGLEATREIMRVVPTPIVLTTVFDAIPSPSWCTRYLFMSPPSCANVSATTLLLSPAPAHQIPLILFPRLQLLYPSLQTLQPPPKIIETRNIRLARFFFRARTLCRLSGSRLARSDRLRTRAIVALLTKFA